MPCRPRHHRINPINMNSSRKEFLPTQNTTERPADANGLVNGSHHINVAVLDDYQGVALSIVDWSKVSDRANITVFQDHLKDQDAVAERLRPFDVVCVMRERTPMP